MRGLPASPLEVAHPAGAPKPIRTFGDDMNAKPPITTRILLRLPVVAALLMFALGVGILEMPVDAAVWYAILLMASVIAVGAVLRWGFHDAVGSEVFGRVLTGGFLAAYSGVRLVEVYAGAVYSWKALLAVGFVVGIAVLARATRTGQHSAIHGS